MKAKKILFPTDFSHTGDAALEYATSLAKEQNARLLIVHVEEAPLAYNGDMYYGIPEPATAELDSMLRDVKPSDPSVPVEYRLILGAPADAIVRLAEEEGVDLIVLGSHGRTGLSRLLLGSVAEVVVRRSRCPVIVCKPPAHKSATAPSCGPAPWPWE